MERLSNIGRSTGLTCRSLRLWGLMLTLAGVVGRGILQNRLLGLGNLNTQQLLGVLDSAGEAMTIATVSLVLQLLETCAVPIFAFLLVTGVQHTSDFKKYALRVAGVAVLSELPYNLSIGGKLLGYSAQNPVYGLLIALVMLMFFRMYEGKTLKVVVIKIVVTLAAILWASMLRIDNGICIVLIVAALWITRSKAMMQNLFGAAAAMMCSGVSIFYMISPMVFLAIHFCNGEQGEQNRVVNYLAYPVMLLAVGLAGMLLV